MRIKKYLAVVGAVSMLASAIPFTASAADDAEPNFKFSSAEEGKAVITEVTTDEEAFTIPETVKDSDGKEYTVVGVSDYAFALCENLNVINVPDTLDKDNTGNVAFLTSTALMDYLNVTFGKSETVDDVIRKIVKKVYDKDNLTDVELEQYTVEIRNKIKDVDISAADTVEGKVILVLRHFKNSQKLGVLMSGVTYNGLTLCGNSDTYIESYAKARETRGMKWEVKAAYLKGDANGDGKVNIVDAATIAKWVAKKQLPTVAEKPAGDYNGDGVINILDAASIAKDVAKRLL